MPTLPLPPLDDGISLDGGDLPVNSIDDVSAEWAKEIQSISSDAVRDAIQQGQLNMLLAYQNIASYAASQSDPGRATGEYLDEILDEHGCPRQSGVIDDEVARAKMFATPPVVSPDAIIQVANDILAPYTTVSCRYAERSDGWFVSDGTPAWSSHVFATENTGEPFATPNYLDRPNVQITFSGGGGTGAAATVDLFEGTVGGFSIVSGGSGYTSPPDVIVTGAGGSGAVLSSQIENGFVSLLTVINPGSGYADIRRPPGAMPNTDTFGRWFLLRTPDISSLDSDLAALFNGLQNEPSSGVENSSSVGGFFVGHGTTVTDVNVTFLFDFAAATVDDVYNSIISAVDSAIGSSVRWDLIADPLLAP